MDVLNYIIVPHDPDGPKSFVAYGKGLSGDYETALEAAQVIQSNGTGAIYIRMDHVFAMVLRVQEAHGATAARLLQEVMLRDVQGVSNGQSDQV